MADKTKGQKKANEAGSLFGGLLGKGRLAIYNREDQIDAAVDDAVAGKDSALTIKKKPKK